MPFTTIAMTIRIIPQLICSGCAPRINSAIACVAMITAANYALSGFVAWPIAAEFIAGGALGGLLGMRSALLLGQKKRALNYLFAAAVFAVAVYMLVQSTTVFASS